MMRYKRKTRSLWSAISYRKNGMCTGKKRETKK